MSSSWPRSIHCWPHSSLRWFRGHVAFLKERQRGNVPTSRLVLVGRWTGADGEVHARTMGSGKNRGPYTRGVQTFCMKPWKYMDGPFGPARPEGLRRVDFLDFTSRITCFTCLRAIDAKICGSLPRRPDEVLLEPQQELHPNPDRVERVVRGLDDFELAGSQPRLDDVPAG